MSCFTTSMIAILFFEIAAAAQLQNCDFSADASLHVRKRSMIPHKSETFAEDEQPSWSKVEAVPITATPWPDEFTINFTTKDGSAWGWLAYDWAKKQQLIAHGPGSTECEGLGADDACFLLFNPRGTYAILPSVKRCRLDIVGVGSLPPDWTTTGVYVDTQIVQGVGLCKAFAFPPTAHLYLETVPGGLPCEFVFPVPSMTYVFLPNTLKIGKPESQLFNLPDYCSENSMDAW